MIGREGDVRPFDLIRWARAQAVFKSLKPLEAHVLLLLATYANVPACEAWPSIATLAKHCGLRPSANGTSSSVSKALRGLEEKELIWTKQAGRGHPARRELLYNPATKPYASAEGNAAQATREDGRQNGQPHGPATRAGVCEPHAHADAKYQENGQDQLPEGTARGSHTPTGVASHPPRRMASEPALEPERAAVRDAIHTSLNGAPTVAP